MSHRTKLIIAALFLVLLAIPIGYVALTWRVPNPLRVRHLGLGQPEMVLRELFDTDKTSMIPLYLELENTAAVPIFVEGAELHVATPPGKSSLPVDFEDLHATEPWIPAHGTIPRTVYLMPEIAQTLGQSELFMRYSWITRTQHRFSEMIGKLADRFESETLYRMTGIAADEGITPVEGLPAASPP